VTGPRAEAFNRLAVNMTRAAGAAIVDWFNMTRSRWESSWDGLHYACQLNGDNWGSQVASMMFQVALNVLFPECTGQ
jgi:hypothetical protein